jgi:hypothetical protein
MHSGPGDVPDAAGRVVKAAMSGPDGPTGEFFSDDNVVEPVLLVIILLLQLISKMWTN